MPDLWMDVDTAVTVPANKLPLIDPTDFKTIEDNTIAYNAAGIEVIWHFVTTGGVMTSTPITPTTGGNYDWTHSDGGVYKIEIPASGGASANNDTEGVGWITGKADACLPFAGPTIGFRVAALNNSLIDGTTIDVNLTAIGGGTQSATDLKDFADDGYDPATNKVQGVVLTDTVTTYTGNTPQTGDSFARLGAPAGASVSADILAIDNLVDDLESRLGTPSNLGSGATVAANLVDIEGQTDDIGAAGAGLTAVPWNPTWDAEVESEATDALNAYDPPTRAELTTDTNSILSKVLKYVQLIVRKDAAIATDNATEVTAINADGGSGAGAYANTTDSLEANRDNLGTNGAALSLAKTTNITGFNDLSAAQVNTEADTALSDYDPPTHAELVSEINSVQADIAALNNLSAAQVNAEVDQALADVNLDHLVGTATGIPAIPAGTYIDQMMDDGTAVYDRTTDSLQAIRDRGDAAWDTADISALALQTSVDDLEGRLTAGRAANLDNLDAAISTRATPAQVNAEVVDVVGTDIIPDSVSVDGTRPTINQALLMIARFLMEKSVSGTTVTVRKEDGATAVMTFTLNDATTPTSITRAT